MSSIVTKNQKPVPLILICRMPMMNRYIVLINIVVVLGAKLRHFPECHITCPWKSYKQSGIGNSYKSTDYENQ